MSRETESYNRLIKFYKIEPLLEGWFMVLSAIFKIGLCLETLLEMLWDVSDMFRRPQPQSKGWAALQLQHRGAAGLNSNPNIYRTNVLAGTKLFDTSWKTRQLQISTLAFKPRLHATKQTDNCTKEAKWINQWAKHWYISFY
jgi:hypothetical protein